MTKRTRKLISHERGLYYHCLLRTLDDLLEAMNMQYDVRSRFSDAEIVTVAVVSAKYFQNHHERALGVA